jgi:NAD(P)-dependent dehydrogenase (short-subunit alcohol dehydrogenase family)
MIYSLDDIKNKVCVITGGGGVIGTVLAAGLVEAGAKVVVLDYKKECCDTCSEIIFNKTNVKITCVVANVLEKESLIEAKKLINLKLGKVDVLINGAGGNNPTATTENEFITMDNLDDLSKSFFGLDINGFRSVFDLNFLGTILPTMVFAEDLIGRGGSIINISSMNSFRPLTKIPAYSAAKASINNFTEWLAVHMAKANVRVNALAPGFFITKQNEFLLIDADTKELTERGQRIICNTPMGRFGKPEDLIGTLLYLISDISSFITGVVIPVDGGFNVFSGV